MIIGCDFDNTIADYSQAFPKLAKKLELVPDDFIGGKQEIREFLRSLDEGEKKWQALQGQMYGNYIRLASVMKDFEKFLKTAKKNNTKITIISHKTKFGHFDEKKTNLQKAAIKWLKQKKLIDFFQDVKFGQTRQEKINLIKELSPDVFIDDLAEVFDNPNFPTNIKKILFSKSENSWDVITKKVFYAR